jgi:hypothetical protein
MPIYPAIPEEQNNPEAGLFLDCGDAAINVDIEGIDEKGERGEGWRRLG